MIVVRVDVAQVDIFRMEGFPPGMDDEDLYETLLSGIQALNYPTHTLRYLMTVALFLMDNYESHPWQVIGYVNQVEVARLEYSLPSVAAPPIPIARVSRYTRDPVI